MDNYLSDITFSELADGRTFIIPAYQRGYRWNKRQVRALLNDLMDYYLSLSCTHTQSYYYMQPIVIRKMETCEYDVKDLDNVWEVVDGQQRLTTLYILAKYLKKCDNEDEYDFSNLYSIIYESRINDAAFLLNIAENIENQPSAAIANIDTEHMCQTYETIKNWFETDDADGAKALFGRYNQGQTGGYKGVFRRNLCQMLTTKELTQTLPSAIKFIQYEITNDTNNDSQKAIVEFLKLNTNNIKLTDAELIKALFLQNRYQKEKTDNLGQSKMAMEWEDIENTLHNNAIWCFLSNDEAREDNRITLILELIYRNETGKLAPLKDAELFDYYYKKFEDISHKENPKEAVQQLWRDTIITTYRNIKNWYANPYIYNYVGLLIKRVVDLLEIFRWYTDSKTIPDFIEKLKESERSWLQKHILYKTDTHRTDYYGIPLPEIGKGNYRFITLQYKDQYDVINLLRFVNMLQFCQQIDEMKKLLKDPHIKKSDSSRSERELMSSIYRFPYDVLDAQMWDIEHVDSATTNEMTKSADQELWVENTIQMNDELMEVEDIRLAVENQKWRDAISYILQEKGEGNEQEGAQNDDYKNWVGNLVLLDSGTNRSYHNAIFCDKKRKLQQRINRGIFVPPFTKLVFEKTFEGNDYQSPANWTIRDKVAYHTALLTEVVNFVEDK